MKAFKIEKTELIVSPVCLGADKFGDSLTEEESFRILDEYRDFGGNFLDTAAVYGRWLPHGENISEKILGRWLSSRGAKGRVVIATKGGHYSFSDRSVSRVRKDCIRHDLQESLRTLGLETVDFYWLHRDDPTLPIGEILTWMEELKKEGLLRFYGASNYSAARLEEADAYAKEKGITGFSAVSNRWSPAKENPGCPALPDPTLVLFEDADLSLFRKTGMTFIPYGATAKGYFEKRAAGALTETLRKRYGNRENDRLWEELSAEAKASGKSTQACLLLKILTGYDASILPITSVSRREQLSALKEVFD